MTMLAAHLSNQPLPMKEANPKAEVSSEVERVVMQCLEKDPAKRPQTARELAERFRQAAGQAAAAAPRPRSEAGIAPAIMIAAAAVLVVAVSWARWRQDQSHPATIRSNVVATATPFAQRPLAASTTGAELGQTLVATNDSSDFTLLPGVMPSPNEDATVVRVQMQRAALGALGLTVNEEHAADWIQVDLLVGDDGLPQAVRLPENSN